MALITCSECSREISDRAEVCPGCGAPVGKPSQEGAQAPRVTYDSENDQFSGNMVAMMKLGMRAVQELGWKLNQANETLGVLTFETGMTLGSYSGVSCSLLIEEVSSGKFRVTGTGKQNVRGGQLIAFNFFGEAEGKARQAIDVMKWLCKEPAEKMSPGNEPDRNTTDQVSSDIEVSSQKSTWSRIRWFLGID